MTHSAVNSDQVAELFAERQRYESWLTTLESKRATTPAHIYHRVHADYAARLQRVIEQLATHRAALQEMESELIDRLTSLDIDEAKHRDEAAEVELRATVGELTPEHRRAVAEQARTALEAVERERAETTGELMRLRAVLEAGGITPAALRGRGAGAASGGGAGVPVESGASAPASAGAVAEPAPSAASAATHHAAPEPGSGSSADWDLSFEKTPEPPAARPSSASGAGASASSGGARRASGELDIERSGTGGPFDDLEFLKTMVDARSSGENVTVGTGVDARESGGTSGGSGATSDRAHAAAAGAGGAGGVSGAVDRGVGSAPPEQSRPPAAVPAMDVRHPEEISLSSKETTPEQVKTLKCQECGTLNYPTEWYCERCGAELAAL